jgi:hypothetical protein
MIAQVEGLLQSFPSRGKVQVILMSIAASIGITDKADRLTPQATATTSRDG